MPQQSWNFRINLVNMFHAENCYIRHQLADEQFHKPGGIDIHFGADLFYEMLRSGRMTRPGNYQVQ